MGCEKHRVDIRRAFATIGLFDPIGTMYADGTASEMLLIRSGMGPPADYMCRTAHTRGPHSSHVRLSESDARRRQCFSRCTARAPYIEAEL